jgi:hypothetical protein
MHAIYPAKFRDRIGTEVTSITNDGERLAMMLRGVEFESGHFNAFLPVEGTDAERLSAFDLEDGWLCSGVIDTEMPIPLVTTEKNGTALLLVHLQLDDPPPRNPFQGVSLQLLIGDRLFRSSGTSGWFEDELLELQRQLPENTCMKACINCAFSDYSPFGHQTFGDMMCFRKHKDLYRMVRTKSDLLGAMRSLTGSASALRAESDELPSVQETYLCPEFELRSPGTGYRG